MPVRLFVMAALSIFSIARADITVNDPQNFLPEMATQLGVKDWSQAFQCGDRRTFLRDQISCESKCSSLSCVDQCVAAQPADKQFDLDLEDCTDTSVAIYGTNGYSATVLKDDYLKTGSWVAAFLQNIGTFLQPVGQIEITFGMPRLFMIIENGQAHQEFGYLITFEHKALPDAMATSYDVGFLTNRGLLDSLVWFATSDKGDVFLKKRGVSLAN